MVAMPSERPRRVQRILCHDCGWNLAVPLVNSGRQAVDLALQQEAPGG